MAINYRVGPLGFLFDGTEEAPGNAGLYDQLLGLKWIRKNIDVFGGNPNQVTIFGESAGAMSVSHHILSPLSKNLFKNAILQSGATYIVTMTKTEAINNAKKYSQEVGCKDESDWIKCLKQIDAKTANSYNFNFYNFFGTLSFLPVVGEAFFPIQSYQAFKTGKFNSGINILAGVAANEGSIFVAKWFDEIDSDSSKLNHNVKEYIHKKLNVKNLKSEENKKKAIDFYIADEIDVDQIKNKTGLFFGHWILTCPTYYVQRDIMLWSGDNKVFMYKLTYKSKMSFSSLLAGNDSWIGVSHLDDIEFVFGTSLLYPEKYSQQDYQFSLLVMNLWTNFAKTG